MNSHHSHGLARRRFIHSAVVLGEAGLWLPKWARAGLVAFIQKSKGVVKLQGDQKLVFKADWEDAGRRLAGVRGLVRMLADIAAA